MLRSLMIYRCFVVSTLVAVLDVRVMAQGTLRLSAQPASPSGVSQLHLSTPYAGHEAQFYAVGPAGTAFQLGAPRRTDAEGKADLAVTLLDDPALGGANGVFFATVANGQGPPAITARVGVRFPVAGEPIVAEPGYLADVSRVAPLGFLVATFLDLDGNGNLDILGATSGGSLAVLVNDGTGAFTDESTTRLNVDPISGVLAFIPADLDGDGDGDVFVCTAASDANNWVLLAQDGVFDSLRPVAKGAESFRTNGAVVADLDGDRDLDVFTLNGASAAHGGTASPQVNVLYFNDGAANFTASEEFAALEIEPAINRSADAGDVDGDGDLDLVVGTSTANHLLLNDGSGQFTVASERLPPAADSTYGVRFTDVDLDGDLDLAISNTMFNPAAQVLLVNQGNLQGGEEGQFAPGEFPGLESGQSPIRLGLEVADVDADGDPDLIFPVHELGNNEAPDLYLNQGGAQQGNVGAFVKAVVFPVPVGVYSQIPMGDIDGDGDLDALVLGAELGVLRSQIFTGVNPPLAFRRGDVNEDGAQDLSDAVAILGYLFLGATAPACELAADVNDSGEVDLSDAVALLGHLFLGSSAPPAPYPAFGDPLSAPVLSCDRVRVFEE